MDAGTVTPVAGELLCSPVAWLPFYDETTGLEFVPHPLRFGPVPGVEGLEDALAVDVPVVPDFAATAIVGALLVRTGWRVSTKNL
jgi:hypothetical protein